MSVHAGSYLDPDELPGLAHFCEHMLFLGTSEYPEENSFRRFLSARGGGLNAYTTEQDTTYFFDVSPSSLQPALTRFASFFKDPLFTASATGRELAAIESEDAKNRQSDSFRLNQLGKSFAAQGHPQRKFSTGNLKTLLAEPQRRGIDTRTALLSFFGQYYDAGLMALCVLGQEPASVLLASVEEAFRDIPARGLANPNLIWRGLNPYPPLLLQGEQQLIQAVPVLERRSLSASWPIVFESAEERLEWVRCKPYIYVSYMLGHEGTGSLLSILKRKGWVDGVLAGVTREDDNFATMRVSFELTEAGLEAREGIFEAMYSVVRRLEQGIPDHVVKECRELAEMRWRFRAKGPALNTALACAEQMQRGVGPEDYVSGRALISEAKGRPVRELVAALLRQLTPSRGQHSSIAREYEAKADAKERWYGTDYSLAPIPAEALRRWAAPPALPGYAPPGPNPFVPRDFELRTALAPPQERAEAVAEPPALLRDDPRWRVFWKPDRAFGAPKAIVRIFIWLPQETVDEDAVPSRLWQLALVDRLAEPLYDAGPAGLGYDVATTMEGVVLEFGGYSDKLVLLVERVLASIRNFDGPDEKEFRRGMDIVRREQRSFDKQQPLQYAAYMARLCVLAPEYTIEFLRQQASRMTPEQGRAFSEKFRSRRQEAFGQALLQGNLDKASANRLQKALDQLPFQALPRERLTRIRLTKLPPGRDNWFLRPGLNPEEANHALFCSYFTGAGSEAELMTQLLQSIVQDPFFGQLRTDKQLGYIVQTQADHIGSVARLVLAIQSSVAAPDLLLDAVDEFLRGFRKTLAELPAADLAAYKVALVEQIVKPDEQLNEESFRWWEEITLFQYSWRRRSEEAELVLGITQQRLLAFFDEFIAEGGARRQRLVSGVFAKVPGREAAMAAMRAKGEARGVTIISEPDAFRTGLPQWPLDYRGPTDSL